MATLPHLIVEVKISLIHQLKIFVFMGRATLALFRKWDLLILQRDDICSLSLLKGQSRRAVLLPTSTFHFTVQSYKKTKLNPAWSNLVDLIISM